MDDIPEAVVGENWIRIKGVKTPKGSEVDGVYERSPDFTEEEKKTIDEKLKKEYPKARKASSATVKYNCHSYAWYKNSLSNSYWIDEAPNVYIEDGSYVLSDTPKSGYKAYFGAGEHSGIVTVVKKVKGQQVIKIKSKWGAAGLYIHESDYSPYSTSIEYYKKAEK